MRPEANSCIRIKHIDSFQKLRVLLFFHEHPGVRESATALAKRLYLGDAKLMEKIITDLQQVGFIEEDDSNYSLRDSSSVRRSLQCLSNVFEKPLSRQKLLNEISLSTALNNKSTMMPVIDCPQCPFFSEVNKAKQV